ncbi:MAG TPA: lysophospholipid acyltransferase family protein [Chitinophagaceae bacterium]|nr:lysophospholipid acyltransferase family protein [Chitinophagaceae bacterium]
MPSESKNEASLNTHPGVWGEIFARFWAPWGIVLFLSTMMIAFIFYIPCFIIKEPYAGRWHRKVSRVWMTIFLNLIGCPFKVKSNEYFKHGQNYVVVCNHSSLMDIPITTPFMPRANKTIAKTSLAFIPVFGWIYSAGSVLVNRKSDKSRRESFDKMKQALNQGFDMVIYPEGTRNRSNDPLKSFYDGAFRLAVETQKPIMPAILFNTKKVLPADKIFYLYPHKLEMHLLPPVESFNISPKELKIKVFRMMWDYYEANM